MSYCNAMSLRLPGIGMLAAVGAFAVAPATATVITPEPEGCLLSREVRLMPGHAQIALPLIAGAALSACATRGWDRLQDEFPEVRANCGLRGTLLRRDATDKRLLRLVFRQRHNAALQARRDGRLACVEHWARERAWRLTTAPGGEGI